MGRQRFAPGGGAPFGHTRGAPPLELGKLVLGVSAPPPPHGFPRASPRARSFLRGLLRAAFFCCGILLAARQCMGNVEHDRQRGHTIAGAVAPAGAPVLAAAVPVQEQESVEELRAARLRSVMQRREQQAQPMPKPSQAKPLLATDPWHAGHGVPSDRPRASAWHSAAYAAMRLAEAPNARGPSRRTSLAGQGGGALAHPLPAAPDFTRYAAQSKNVL